LKKRSPVITAELSEEECFLLKESVKELLELFERKEGECESGTLSETVKRG